MVKAQFAPVLSRLDALEKRFDDLPTPKEVQDADPDAVAQIVREQIKADLDELRGAIHVVPTQPVGLTEDQVKSMVERVEEIAAKNAEASIAKAIAGADKSADLAALQAEVAAIVIPEPVELPDIPAMVAEAVKAIPAPRDGEDGKSVSIADVSPVIAEAVQEAVSKAVAAMPPAKDGIGLAGALIDRAGDLVITLTNGEAKNLGPVVGKDAEPALPGRDGLGFDDLEFEEKDGRLYAVFRRGDLVKAARLPGISYRGVWKSGDYLTGDSVTFGACQWIAKADTSSKPGEGEDWQLAVRKGRDGRDAEGKSAKADTVKVR